MGIKLSIITPSYNHGKFIRQTIESVLKQDYPDYEHIIIDGGSTDNTIDILKEYPHLNWISERDTGAANAINKGISIASGEILAWLNSDDYYERNIFLKIVKAFELDNSVGLVYGNLTYISENGEIIRKEKTNIYDYNNLVKNSPDLIRQPCSFFRKSILDEIGELDESLKCVFDYDLILKILKITDAYYLDTNLTYYRDYMNTLTRKFIRKQGFEILKVARKNGASISDRIFAKTIIKKILLPGIFVKSQ